jgi:hypothetical protein
VGFAPDAPVKRRFRARDAILAQRRRVATVTPARRLRTPTRRVRDRSGRRSDGHATERSTSQRAIAREDGRLSQRFSNIERAKPPRLPPRHCERSEAIQRHDHHPGLPRGSAARNDGRTALFALLCFDCYRRRGPYRLTGGRSMSIQGRPKAALEQQAGARIVVRLYRSGCRPGQQIRRPVDHSPCRQGF